MSMAAPYLDAIPEELRRLDQWVVWRPTKIPYDPKTGELADSTDAATWGTFDQAVATWRSHTDRFAGIGFVFAANDPYCGIDFDDCLDEHGDPFPRAEAALRRLSSYCEISPSGRGVKIIVRGAKPGQRCKKVGIEWTDQAVGAVEMYDRERYFTITGRVVPDTVYTIEDRQDKVEWLYRKVFPEPTTNGHVAAPKVGVVERCRKYLAKCPDSISGAGGHDRFLRAACECMRFGLSDADTLETLRWWANEKSGDEPWNEREIEHKIKSARDKTAAAGEIGSRLRDDAKAPPAAPAQLKPPPKAGASRSVRERLGRIIDGTYAAVPWPWETMTRLSQSLLPGTVTLFCGKPSAGKSFFMLGAAIYWLASGVPFAVFMLEEDRDYHLQRALAILERNGEITQLNWIKANPVTSKDAWGRHADTLDALGAAIHDAPESRVSLTELAEWYESIAPSVRLAVIDPVTYASTGESRWLDDGKFMERVKTISRKNETSLILVTHPRIGTNKSAINLDDLAGGADYSRFSQSVFVLDEEKTGEDVTVLRPFGRCDVSANRIVHIRKARNGRGGGSDIAFDFDNNLRFNELGVLVR